jgi:hypothetical protein
MSRGRRGRRKCGKRSRGGGRSEMSVWGEKEYYVNKGVCAITPESRKKKERGKNLWGGKRVYRWVEVGW